LRKLEDLIERNNIFINPPVNSKDDLFKFFVDILFKRKIINDKEAILKELIEREKKGSTGIGNSVAIPHLRVRGIKDIYIFVALLREGIDFDSIDGKPVRLIFLILAPEEKQKEYLSLLSNIAVLLRNEDFLNKILKCEDASSLISLFVKREKENFYEKNRKMIWFILSIVFIFLIFSFTFGHLKVPDVELARTQGLLKFNENEWIRKQIISSTIFFATVIGTLLFWQFRVAFATIGLGILLISGTMDIVSAVEFMSIPTILFIISMMMIISWLEEMGLFDFLISNVLKKVGAKPRVVFIILIFISVLLGGLTGEVTGIIVVSTLALSLCSTLGLDPFPFIISLVFATNLGSALTLVGNPIGVYIAFSSGLTIEDFFRWATPVSLFLTVFMSFFLLFIFRKKIPKDINGADLKFSPYEKVAEKGKLKIGGIIFLIILILIGFSGRIDNLLHLLPNTILVAIPITFAGFIIFYEKSYGKIIFKEGVDWWTIIFFMFLFANAACLEYTGVTTKLAFSFLNISEKFSLPFLPEDLKIITTALVIITSFTGLASGFVDNLPIIAALVPLVKTIQAMGFKYSSILWWGLLFGGCFGGNLTMIGSSANIVAISLYEKSEGKTIGFQRWFKYGVPVVFLSIIFSILLLIIQIRWAK